VNLRNLWIKSEGRSPRRYSPVLAKRAGSHPTNRLVASGRNGFPRYAPSNPFIPHPWFCL